MSAPEPAEFSAEPFDQSLDLCGDVLGAGLRALFAGNQFMVLPELFAAFSGATGSGPVFYETLPPGIIVRQLRSGALRVGALELRFTPDLIASSPAALAALKDEGLVGEATVYASNCLTLLVAPGNPMGIESLADLGRPGVRLALPDPRTEGIGRLALAALEDEGGSALRQRIQGHKREAGETLLTSIHHRQSPSWLAQGLVDAAIVWETEAIHAARSHQPVQALPLDPLNRQRGRYAAAVVHHAPHPGAAAALEAFLNAEEGRQIYRSHGFQA
ncbi:substrate-binding domain-containing protein [Sinomonas sp.]|uniref:substrate-binding domain-containing protein n=1 Tax=Sinomonas sp. TaxID=1914986 RepID=UPI002FE25E21